MTHGPPFHPQRPILPVHRRDTKESYGYEAALRLASLQSEGRLHPKMILVELSAATYGFLASSFRVLLSFPIVVRSIQAIGKDPW